MNTVFESTADAYDNWYETPEGSAIFREELQCLRSLCDSFDGRWLEVGIGTGRFATALGIPQGIDRSFHMVFKAVSRGVRGQVGRAEQLPFRTGSFDGLLIALTLCFLEDPEAAFWECARVLRDKGKLLIGTIPADSPWGRAYIKKAAEGHPAYSRAHFRTIAETLRLAGRANFKLQYSCSALLWEPGSHRPEIPKTCAGLIPEAGFVGLLFDAHS